MDIPQVYSSFAQLLASVSFADEDVEEIAKKINVDGEPMIAPADKLKKEFAKTKESSE